MVKSWIGLFLFAALFSCSLNKSINDGRTAYEQKQFSKAITLLESEIAGKGEGPEYAELSYLLGESYKYINDSDNSLKWYIEAAKNNHGPEAFWEMAYALKKKERYEDAILSFQRLLQMTNGRENDIRKEIEKCKIARQLKNASSQQDFLIEPLLINSAQSDYAPYLMDANRLIFTSDRLFKESDPTYAWTGNAFSDIYEFNLNTNELKLFSSDINTPANEGTAVFNTANTEMFFTRCFSETGDGYCRILRSEWVNGQWSEGEPIFRMKPNVNYGDPVLIEDDQVLIFSSNDPIGIGSHDLYYSLREDDGTWSDPELMPPYLNTVGSERFPRWHDSTLYYSSDFFPGLGGLDIFRTRLNPDGTWTQPQNVGVPINSSEDDYALVVVPDQYLTSDIKKKYYFTSTRGVFGNDDLYSLTEFKSIDEISIHVDTLEQEIIVAEEVKKSLFLEIRVKEKIYAVSSNPNSYVVGYKDVEGASVRFKSPDREDIFTTKQNGTILVPIDTGIVYPILVGKLGYLNNGLKYQIEDDYTDLEDGQVLSLEIEIERIFEGVEVVLENIYYDFNESYIRDDAKPSLDYLIKILTDNPAVNIELSSHTDCRGDEDYNQRLSQNRAESAVNYIVKEGLISLDRLIASGYGESRLEITCICEECSEEEHQINRRTTFKIVKK